MKRLLCRIFGHRIAVTYNPLDALLGASLRAPELIPVRIFCERCGDTLGRCTADFSRFTGSSA